MNEILMYVAVGFGLLLLALLIPGIKVLAEMLLKGIFAIFGEIFKHKGTFVVWILKTLASDHARVLQHMFQAQNDIDPTARVRKQS